MVSVQPIDKVLSAFGECKKVPPRTGKKSSYLARCPAHDDQHPSLSLDEVEGGKVLVLCRVCGREKTPDILRAVGLSEQDLFPREDEPPQRQAARVQRQVVATFDYRDEAGELLYQSVRLEPGKDGRKKDFSQRRPDGNGGWVYNLDGVPRVLYRLPELLDSHPEATVWIPEGERKVDALRGLGLVAVCNVGGAGKWRPEYSAHLRGRQVVLLPDNDGPGRDHAGRVAAALEGVALGVVTLQLPGLPPKGDVLDWLAAGGTRQELERLAEAAVKQPPPQANGSAAPRPVPASPLEWEQPIPLNDVEGVMAFPLDVLPARLRDFLREVADSKHAPPDYAAVPLLAVAGAAVGASRVLQIKPGWNERPCLYTAVVAPPGSAKTPAIKDVASPVYSEQARLREIYVREKRAFDEELSKDRPVPQTVYVSDVTTEKLAEVLQENPRGVVMLKDELTSWVTGMDQYKPQGRGSDRQVFLHAWSGEPISVHRKNQEHGPVFVAHPFVAIAGGLPPSCLAKLRGEPARFDDGFLDRILFAYPDPLPVVKEDWLCVSEQGEKAWSEALKELRSMQGEFDDKGTPRPHFVKLTADARLVWECFTEDLATSMNDEGFSEHLRGPWSKMRGYCARLALILHCLRLAVGEKVGEDVDDVSLSQASVLVSYFQSHAARVYAALDADPRGVEARHVLKWLARNPGVTSFRRSNLYENLRRSFKAPEDLDRPLDLLVQHRYLRPAQEEEKHGPGRRPTPRYEVNILWGRQTIQTIQEIDA